MITITTAWKFVWTVFILCFPLRAASCLCSQESVSLQARRPVSSPCSSVPPSMCSFFEGHGPVKPGGSQEGLPSIRGMPPPHLQPPK